MLFVTPYDVYLSYKKQEGIFKEKKPRIYNDISRLSPDNVIKLQKLADYFNTIWHNINIDTYMSMGFKLWKSFNIDKVDDERIIKKYISNDKKIKRSFEEITKEDISKSISYIIEEYGSIPNYCKDNSFIRQPISDYVKNKIDPITLLYLKEKKLMGVLRGEEISLISYIMNNYEQIKQLMYKYYNFIEKMVV